MSNLLRGTTQNLLAVDTANISTQYISSFDALSICIGPVAAVLLCIKREEYPNNITLHFLLLRPNNIEI